jgi:Mce-associated membrane protein
MSDRDMTTGLSEPGDADAGASAEHPTDAPPPEPTADEGGARDGNRLAWIVAAVAGFVAVLAIVGMVILFTWWAPLNNEAQDREQVRRVGESFTVHIATFSGENIDDWVAETQERATGNYAEQVDELFDEELRAALRELEVESQGELVNLFVQELDGDEATLFALVRQRVSNAVAEEPFEDELRMELQLGREDGEWLVSDVAVLGPSQGGVAAPVPEEAQEEEE